MQTRGLIWGEIQERIQQSRTLYDLTLLFTNEAAHKQFYLFHQIKTEPAI